MTGCPVIPPPAFRAETAYFDVTERFLGDEQSLVLLRFRIMAGSR